MDPQQNNQTPIPNILNNVSWTVWINTLKHTETVEMFSTLLRLKSAYIFVHGSSHVPCFTLFLLNVRLLNLNYFAIDYFPSLRTIK